MSFLADFYPNEPIDIKRHIKSLPKDSSVPGLPDWRYIHTPGHAPGHISLWREKDKILIAGDAFVTTRQESALSVILQYQVISGPPKYFTYDWAQAEESVQILAALEPEIVAAGHGKPMSGNEMLLELEELAEEFKDQAIPKHGRYVSEPAIADKNGVVYVPQKEADSYTAIVAISGIAAVLVLGWILISKNARNKREAGV